jgi:hypothetical protein
MSKSVFIQVGLMETFWLMEQLVEQVDLVLVSLPGCYHLKPEHQSR